MGAGTLLGAFPARRGTDHRQHRQAPAPSRADKPAAHGRTGLDARRIAVGHQGHQELQCHGIRQAEILRPERRPGAADPFDGPPPAAGFADERIPGHLGRRRHPGIRRFARIQGRAQPRRLHRLHRHVLADNASGTHVHRPVLQHQPGYRRRRTHLLDHRRPKRDTGQTRGDRTRRAERQDRIPRHPLLVRRQPRGDRRHLVRDQARRNRGPGRPFGRRQVDPQRTHTAFLRREGGRHPDRRGFGAPTTRRTACAPT